MSSAPSSVLPKTTPQQVEYLWVNQDKNNGQGRPESHVVRSHVQNWRKSVATVFLRPSSRVSPDVKFSWRRKTENYDGDHPKLRHPPKKKQAICLQPQQAESKIRDIGPLTVLRKGNSDPFNVFAIPIDSKANRMMTFFRTVVLPTVESGADWVDSASFSYDWNNAVKFLTDKMTALAHLTRVAVAMTSKNTPENTQRALVCKSQSMALLRDRVADHRITEFSTYHAIYLLLLSEAYSRNLPAALVHANLLSELLQSGQVKENFQFVFRTFYYDYQRAAMSQSRLCFDIKYWVPTFFEPFWRNVTDHLPSCALTAIVSHDLDPSINDERMRSIFIAIRQAHLILNTSVSEAAYTSDDKSRYCRSFWPWIMAQLHHRYLEAAEILEQLPPPGGDARSTHIRVQAFFSLAAHCYTRKLVNVDATSFGETEIFNANAGILVRLREVLDDYERSAAPADMTRYERIYLWTLYVGAFAEQAKALKEGTHAEYGWFSSNLARQARSMKLVFWHDLRIVLERIHYSDGPRPHASEWFWKMMNAKPSGEGTIASDVCTDKLRRGQQVTTFKDSTGKLHVLGGHWSLKEQFCAVTELR